MWGGDVKGPGEVRLYTANTCQKLFVTTHVLITTPPVERTYVDINETMIIVWRADSVTA